MQARPGGKSCFSHTNASNFRQPLKSLLLRYTLKILRLPNFNMLFQLVLTTFFKSELFSCLLKVDHVIKSCKEPILQQKSNQQVTKKIKTLAVRTGVRAYTDATLLTTSAYLKQCKSFHHLHNLLCMSTNMTQ